MADEKINLDEWNPRTKLGKQIKDGIITNVDHILDNGIAILEPEIVDFLLPGLNVDYLNLGQAKGKFGGGKRRPVRQTQKKTEDGNTLKFSSFAAVGNGNGVVGVGLGKSKDTLPSKNKSLRAAKLNLIKIRRGCGSWACGCATAHSIPFTVKGKCGSVEVELRPAPKGTGLKINKECAKVLKLAGIKDIWSRTRGHTEVKINHIFALFNALKKLTDVKILPNHIEQLGIVDGTNTQGVATIEDLETDEIQIEEPVDVVEEEEEDES